MGSKTMNPIIVKIWDIIRYVCPWEGFCKFLLKSRVGVLIAFN
jgi:hypothetical protein